MAELPSAEPITVNLLAPATPNRLPANTGSTVMMSSPSAFDDPSLTAGLTPQPYR